MAGEHELQRLVDVELGDYLDTGRQVRSVEAWRRNCRERILQNERAFPGFIDRSVAGMDAAERGERITQCAESRGSHAMSYVYDPIGTAQPPSWWNRHEAKRHENRRRRERGLPEFP